jgi:acyl-CoA reductase-like NAD-dependent aldehyde dehydrogenase
MDETAGTEDSAGPFPAKSPASGKELPSVEATKDVVAVVEAARAAQAKWAELSVERRARLIGKLKKAILQRAEEIGKLIHDETGKPEAEALLGEVLASADVVSYWVEIAPEELEPMEADLDALAYPKKRAMIHREPRGVIALVMPWNFPFALPLRTIVPALLAGNSVVLKPSEITPRTGQLIFDLLKSILPEGVFSVVQGGGDVGGALIAADVDFVVFTGSTATGKKVAHACADLLRPCVVELGGKDAAIVLKDADLERAANGILWGAMMNAGQNCGAVERVYAEKDIADALAKKIAEAAKALRFKDDFGPLTTPAQRAIVERHVAAAKEAGAKVLAGGEGIEAQGFQPTVVTMDADDNPLIADETFGPVVPVTAVNDVEEAIKRANASRYGLTASLWTKDVRRRRAWSRSTTTPSRARSRRCLGVASVRAVGASRARRSRSITSRVRSRSSSIATARRARRGGIRTRRR